LETKAFWEEEKQQQAPQLEEKSKKSPPPSNEKAKHGLGPQLFYSAAPDCHPEMHSRIFLSRVEMLPLEALLFLIDRTQSSDFYKKMPLFGSNKTGIWELIWAQSQPRRRRRRPHSIFQPTHNLSFSSILVMPIFQLPDTKIPLK